MIKNKFLSISSGKCLGDKDYNSRYYLEFSLKKSSNKIAIVILMNPSTTARQSIFFNVPLNRINDCDRTTNNVLNILHTKKNLNNKNVYKKIIFLNVFPYYSSSPEQLELIFNKTNKNTPYLKNLKIVDETIKKNINADFYCGWGKNNKLKYGYEDVVDLLKKNNPANVFCFDQAKKCFVNYKFDTCFVYHGSTWK